MQNLDFTQKSSAQKARERELRAQQQERSLPPARLAKINMMRQQAQFRYNIGADLDDPAPPTRGGGGGGGGGRGRGAPAERKKIKGFGGEQAAEKEADDAEKREKDWNERFNKPGNAAYEDRKRTAKETDENNLRAKDGRPSLQTERGAEEFRQRRQAQEEQDTMGGAANQEALGTGYAPAQDGTVSIYKPDGTYRNRGRMAFKGGNVVGTSFARAARR